MKFISLLLITVLTGLIVLSVVYLYQKQQDIQSDSDNNKSTSTSTSTTITTILPTTVPTRPSTSPVVVSFTETGINITWSESIIQKDQVTSYIIKYRLKSTTTFTSINLFATTLTTSINNLVLGQTYEIGLQYVNVIGSSDLSELIDCMTRPTLTNKASQLIWTPDTSIDATSGVLNWTAPNNTNHRYKIDYTETPLEGDPVTDSILSSQNNVAITRLKDAFNSTITFTIAAYGDGIVFNNGSLGSTSNPLIWPSNVMMSQYQTCSATIDRFNNLTVTFSPYQPADFKEIIVMIERQGNFNEPTLFGGSGWFLVFTGVHTLFPGVLKGNVLHASYYIDDSDNQVDLPQNNYNISMSSSADPNYSTGQPLRIGLFMCNSGDDSPNYDPTTNELMQILCDVVNIN